MAASFHCLIIKIILRPWYIKLLKWPLLSQRLIPHLIFYLPTDKYSPSLYTPYGSQDEE